MLSRLGAAPSAQGVDVRDLLSIFHGESGLAIVSTSVAGIRSVLARGRALQDDGAYRAALVNGPTKSTSLVFLDFSQLLSLGEQTGLARSAGDGLLRADLEKVRAIGLDSTSGKTDSTVELFVQIS